MKLAELARVLGATLEGTGADVEITDVAPLEDAGPGTITFLADRRLEAQLAATRASAVLLGPDAPPSPVPVLRVPHPWVAFAHAIELFHPAQRPPAGIHPTAVVAASAVIGRRGVRRSATSCVGDEVRIGRDAVLHPRVTIYRDVAHRRRLHGARGSRGARGRGDRRPGHAARRRRHRQRRLRLRAAPGRASQDPAGRHGDARGRRRDRRQRDRRPGDARRDPDRPRHQDRQPGDDRPRLAARTGLPARRAGRVWRAACAWAPA